MAPSYRRLLRRHGWRMRRPAFEGQTGSLLGTRGDRTVTISVSPRDPGCEIEISLIAVPPAP